MRTRTRTRTRPRTLNRSDTQTACATPQIPIRRHTSEPTAQTAIHHPPSFPASLSDTTAKNPNSPATTPNMKPPPKYTTRTSRQRAETSGRPILIHPSVEPGIARVRARTAHADAPTPGALQRTDRMSGGLWISLCAVRLAPRVEKAG
jgi:hypothetical protein